MYEGISVDICTHGRFGTSPIGLQRYDALYKVYGSAFTENDIAYIKDSIGSEYYLPCDGNTDTLITDTALLTESIDTSCLSTTGKTSFVSVYHRINVSVDGQTMLMNYTDDFSDMALCTLFFDTVHKNFRQLNEGEEWYLDFGNGTGQWIENENDLHDIGLYTYNYKYTNTLWTLTAKTPENVTEVSFIQKYGLYDENPQTTTIQTDVGSTIGKLPQLYNGTIWVYVNENGSYSEFTTETPVIENMEIYNGVKISIMDCDST